MEEFAKIKDEVPSAIMDAHMKNVKEAVRQHALILIKFQLSTEFDFMYSERWRMALTMEMRSV